MITKTKTKILFLAYTSQKYNHCDVMFIDRPDLTRKMSCLETWVPRLEKLGHEVLFFDGSNETQWIDQKNKTLHLIADESYDHVAKMISENKNSLMVERFREAVAWSLKNRDFDYIFRTDDGSYINAYLLSEIIELLESDELDILCNNFLGGAGMFISRRACETFVDNFVNTKPVEDSALAVHFTNPLYKYKIKHSYKLHPFYIIGENLFTMHYTNGKRQYLTDDIISYYYTGSPIKRKVVVGLPLYEILPPEKLILPIKTWDTGQGDTSLWYSFDKDINNWEYYGNYPRSNFNISNSPCVFGKNSLQEFVICDAIFNLNEESQLTTFNNYLDALVEDGVLYICIQQSNINIYGSSKINEYLTHLSEFVDIIKISNGSDEVGLNSEFLQYINGMFIKMKKKGIQNAKKL
jgi:hypothetical protein